MGWNYTDNWEIAEYLTDIWYDSTPSRPSLLVHASLVFERGLPGEVWHGSRDVRVLRVSVSYASPTRPVLRVEFKH